VTQGTWSITISTKNYNVLYYAEGVLSEDRFRCLIQVDGAAGVTTNYGRSLPFAEEKLSVIVSLKCDQNEAAINKAGELSFLKAVELVDDGFGIITELRKKEAEAAQR